MFGKKCNLCGGKIVHGVCTECGLNNKKQDNYRPNQSSCDDMPLTHSHDAFGNVSSEQKPFGVDLNNITNTIQDTIQDSMGLKDTTISNEEFFNQIKQEQMEMEVEDVYHRTPPQPVPKAQNTGNKTNNPRGCFTKIVIFIVAANVIFGLLGSLVGALADGIGSLFEDSRPAEEVLMDDYNYDFDVDPLEDFGLDESEISKELKVVLEQLEQGHTEQENSFVWGPGCYTVGVHIPAGTYYIENLWSGSIAVTDTENSYMLSEYYLDEDRGIIIEEVPLEEGNRVMIDSEGVFALVATSPITNEVNSMENPNTEVVKLNRTAVAGEEFPAGVYDLSMTPTCFGIVEIYLEGADIGAEGVFPEYNGFVCNTDFEEEDAISSIGIKNIVIPEGATVFLDETSYSEEGDFLVLTPSEVIESTDYNAFYKNGFTYY